MRPLCMLHLLRLGPCLCMTSKYVFLLLKNEGADNIAEMLLTLKMKSCAGNGKRLYTSCSYSKCIIKESWA